MTTATQLSVSAAPTIGVPGMEYDSGYSDVITLLAEVAIPFGAYVVQNGDGACILPTATGHVTGRLGGYALRDPSKESGVGYEIGDPVRVMRAGRCYVLNDETVVNTDTVFIRFASGAGGAQLGATRNDADTATAVGVPGAKFYKGGAASLAVVEMGVGA